MNVCPLCASTRTVARPDLIPVIRTVYDGSTTVKCLQCGASFLSPVPRAEHAGEVYNEDYFRAYSDRGIAMPAEAENPPARYVTRLQAVSRGRGAGTLLEIGPGTGAFLNYARNAGWRVIGVETARFAAEKIARQYGVDVRCGTLSTVDLEGKQFDVVHMSHVLEHFIDPAASLRIIHKVLKPGGHVIIEVPNEFENLQFRLSKALGRLRPYPVRSTHVFFFSPSSLRRLLQQSRFTVTHVSTVRDVEARSGIGRLVRCCAEKIERPLGMAPLIQAIAVK
jgi:SAM-dependent methyltransferase